MPDRRTILVGEPSGRSALAGRPVDGVRGVRLPDGTIADLAITDGSLAAGPAAGDVLDATGWRLLPAATEPHAHLDKALTGPRTDPGAGNDLVEAIRQWHAILPGVDRADLRERALAAIARYVANGITTIRSHVDLPGDDDPFRCVETLAELREELAGAVTLQVAALAGPRSDTATIREALHRGADVIGGCPHLADDPEAETTRLLDLAEETGLPVDLHTDEQTTTHRIDIVDLAEQVIARGLQQRVTASHCVRLGMLDRARLDTVLDVVKRAGIGVVTLPITNLYLQGRGDAPSPRGLPPLRALLDAGIPLAAGADNLRDPFNPVGRADPYETTSLLVTAGHLSTTEALAAVTTGGREVLGLTPVGTTPGCAADFVLVPDLPLDEILAGGPTARVVVHRGRVVADTRISTAVDLRSSEAGAEA